jgi:hypothetical protein
MPQPSLSPGASHSLAEPPCRDGADGDRTAFLCRYDDWVCGYLCLMRKVVTGRRELVAVYRSVSDAERVIRPEFGQLTS